MEKGRQVEDLIGIMFINKWNTTRHLDPCLHKVSGHNPVVSTNRPDPPYGVSPSDILSKGPGITPTSRKPVRSRTYTPRPHDVPTKSPGLVPTTIDKVTGSLYNWQTPKVPGEVEPLTVHLSNRPSSHLNGTDPDRVKRDRPSCHYPQPKERHILISVSQLGPGFEAHPNCITSTLKSRPLHVTDDVESLPKKGLVRN